MSSALFADAFRRRPLACGSVKVTQLCAALGFYLPDALARDLEALTHSSRCARTILQPKRILITRSSRGVKVRSTWEVIPQVDTDHGFRRETAGIFDEVAQ